LTLTEVPRYFMAVTLGIWKGTPPHIRSDILHREQSWVRRTPLAS
jgi:hypothetical protein